MYTVDDAFHIYWKLVIAFYVAFWGGLQQRERERERVYINLKRILPEMNTTPGVFSENQQIHE